MADYCVAHRGALRTRPDIWTGFDLDVDEDDEEPQWPRQFAELQELFCEAEKIGRGGFASVYRVRRTSDQELYALKVAHSRFARAKGAMAREVEVLRALGGQGAPRWVESRIGSPGRIDYIVMELVAGASLAQRLATFGQILLADVRDRLIESIFDSVERLHACGFVHNDLKPENILMAGEHQVMLCDFDLALRIGEKPRASGPDDWIGTSEYLAPERIDGCTVADYRSDLYSLGILLYELYVGHPPFWGSEVQVRDSHRTSRPPSLGRIVREQQVGEISEEQGAKIDALHELVHRCLRKDPARRLSSVVELRNAWNDARNKKCSSPRRQALADLDIRSICEGAQNHYDLTRKMVGVLWIHSRCERADFLLRIQEVGGVLVHCDRDRYVVVCGFEALLNPVKASLEAAVRLLHTPDLALQVVVDVATVWSSSEEGESPVFMSELWSQLDRFADTSDGRGLFIHNPAHEMVPSLAVQPRKHGRYARWLARALRDMLAMPAEPMEAIGQHTLMRELKLEVLKSRRGHSSLQWVFGDVGQGKSHISRFLSDILRREHPHAGHFYWRASPQAHLGPRQVFEQLWLALVKSPFRSEQVGIGGSRHLSQWQRHTILEFMKQDFSQCDGAQQAQLAVGACVALLNGIAESDHVILVVDDAHLLHDTILGAFATLLSSSSATFVALLFAQVDEGIKARAEELALEAQRVHHLESLDPEASARQARDLLRHVAAVPQAALRWVAERSAGNPMLITGLVDALHRHGVVQPDGTRKRWVIDCEALDQMPASPASEWLCENQIASWPPGLRGIAQWASLLPPGFRLHHLEELMDEVGCYSQAWGIDANYGLDRLRDAHVLYMDRSRGYHFSHALIRSALARQLDAKQEAA